MKGSPRSLRVLAPLLGAALVLLAAVYAPHGHRRPLHPSAPHPSAQPAIPRGAGALPWPASPPQAGTALHDPFAPLVTPPAPAPASAPKPHPASPAPLPAVPSLPLPPGPAGPQGPAASPQEALRLTGIMMGAPPLAIIEGPSASYVAAPGEPAGDATVIAIDPPRVVLRRGDATLTLSLQEVRP